jgi:hypothetical protein
VLLVCYLRRLLCCFPLTSCEIGIILLWSSVVWARFWWGL